VTPAGESSRALSEQVGLKAFEQDRPPQKTTRVFLLGASFSTGNLGVSALAESSIKIILNRWPGAQITMPVGAGQEGEEQLELRGAKTLLRKVRIRCGKNVFMRNHIFVLTGYGLLLKLLRQHRFRELWSKRNSYLKQILETDIVVDITGGDSFSDIYGLGRFLRVFLLKFAFVQFGKKLVLLPQTYGPYNRRITRLLARYILRRAARVYSRDAAGVAYVRRLVGKEGSDEKIRYLPDVAFILDARRPAEEIVGPVERIKADGAVLVGLNISGLLFHGGYTQDNMFKLKADYRRLISLIVERLVQYERTVIVLIPHVFPPRGFEVEDDADACRYIYEQAASRCKGRILLVTGKYDHSQAKYLIGLCDFFIGSRMHSCIAALSQCIPAVGIAYSKKFHGVFESIGLSDCVVDTRSCDNREALEKIGLLFERREQIRKHLMDVMPKVRKDVLSIFDNGLFKES
jgi:polysaccharide pyruvyl transferase WcaK-like protein